MSTIERRLDTIEERLAGLVQQLEHLSEVIDTVESHCGERARHASTDHDAALRAVRDLESRVESVASEAQAAAQRAERGW